MKRVIIVGGGISGLASAISLSQMGYKITVIEQRTLDKHEGGGLGIQPNGTRALFCLGIKDELLKASGKVECVNIGLDTGKLLNTIPSNCFTKDSQYPVLYLKRTDLINILRNKIDEHNLFTNVRCIDIKVNKDSVQVSLENGKTVNGDLLIGADGINSMVRQNIFGYKPKIYFNHISLGGILNGKCSEFNLLHGYRKFCVSFPCSGGNYYTIMFCPMPEGWLRANAYNHKDQINIFRNWCQDVDNMLDNLVETDYFCLESHGLAPFKTMSNQRVFLIGDSAHPLTPMSGFTATLALEDIVDLSVLLKTTDNMRLISSIYNERRYLRAQEYFQACNNAFIEGILHPSQEKFQARIKEIEKNVPEKVVQPLVNLTHPNLISPYEAVMQRLEVDEYVCN